MEAVKTKVRKVINTSMITTDDYQRAIRASRVKKIVNEFQEIQAEAPKVSWRDNKYFIFDGQHTTRARIVMNGGEDLDVECDVYLGLTKEEEADLFVKLNSNKKSVTFNEKMKGNYIAGNQEAIDIIDIIRSKDVDISFDSTVTKPNTIIALNKATQIYENGGKEALEWVLDVAHGAWEEDKYGMHTSILGGLYIVYTVYGSEKKFSKEDFINVMRTESPSIIMREGRELSIGGDKRFAKRMVERYNKKTSRKLRISKLDI